MLNIGLVRGGEAGEELVFLPKGAQVVPINNNVSGVAEVHITIDSSMIVTIYYTSKVDRLIEGKLRRRVWVRLAKR